MKKNNNEIISIALATLSAFIVLSLIQFKSEYEISDIYYLIIGQVTNKSIKGRFYFFKKFINRKIKNSTYNHNKSYR